VDGGGHEGVELVLTQDQCLELAALFSTLGDYGSSALLLHFYNHPEAQVAAFKGWKRK
jgi:hypothetical protein